MHQHLSNAEPTMSVRGWVVAYPEIGPFSPNFPLARYTPMMEVQGIETQPQRHDKSPRAKAKRDSTGCQQQYPSYRQFRHLSGPECKTTQVRSQATRITPPSVWSPIGKLHQFQEQSAIRHEGRLNSSSVMLLECFFEELASLREIALHAGIRVRSA